MTDLIKQLEAWAEKSAQSGDYEEYFGGRGYDEPAAYEDGARDMLALLAPLIKAAVVLPDAEHGELADALAELRAKVGMK